MSTNPPTVKATSPRAMPPKIHLYRVNGYCSMAPHALLHHLNIPFTTTVMKYGPDGNEAADGTLSAADYRKINPTGYVPALRPDEDGTVITEMPAVLTLIALQAAPEHQGLLGRSPVEKAQVAQWMAWLAGTLHTSGYGAFLRPQRFVDGHEDAYSAVRDKGRRVIEGAYERIESRVRGRRFAVGEGLTTVDFNLYVFYRWGTQCGFQMEEYPEYGRFVEVVEGLDGVRKMLEVEGLTALFGKASL